MMEKQQYQVTIQIMSTLILFGKMCTEKMSAMSTFSI